MNLHLTCTVQLECREHTITLIKKIHPTKPLPVITSRNHAIHLASGTLFFFTPTRIEVLPSVQYLTVLEDTKLLLNVTYEEEKKRA
jgi:hypothetical protein